MYIQNSNSSQNAPCLTVLENGKVRVFPLAGRSQWSIGRGSDQNIPLFSGLASRSHGTLTLQDGKWYYAENPQNTNGTYYNGLKVPRTGQVHRVRLHSGDVLRIQIDRPDSQPVVMLFSTVASGKSWRGIPLSGQPVRIGRSSGCEVCIPSSYVSSQHAQITFASGQCYLSDAGSKAGTWLNGTRITSAHPLHSGDCIYLGGKALFFLGNQLLTEGSGSHSAPSGGYAGNRPVILRADIQTKQVKNNSGAGMKELIRDIHLEIREGTLVALLGTAGAGKSTVMNCLNGMDLEGVRGRVMYRNVDLMSQFDQVKHLIGSVPQKKTFHPSFTPEQEFTFAAQKRLPAGMSSKEIQQRVDRTLSMLSMNGVRNVPNSKLSGGEQTRVNVGIELVADRDLLCLDEPDQGLSPNYKHELFQIMRDLAHRNGKSVLSIIHDVSEIELFDQVIMLAKVDGVGRLAFSGSPEEAKRYFGVDIQYAYALLEQNPKKYVR